MTTVTLLHVPRDLAWPHLVRAICRHVGVPVSSETYWTHGYGDVRIDLGDVGVDAARVAVELYVLASGIEYRIVEDRNNSVTDSQGVGLVRSDTTVVLVQSERRQRPSDDPPRRTAMTQHDHAEFTPGCYRCELSQDEASDLSVDDVVGILGADWTGGLSSVDFVRGQR